MSVRLVILGLLRGASMHGYELRQVIEKEMGDWADIPFGSVYFALGKLREAGFVRACEGGRSGNRPEKTVYELTPAGAEEFMRLLRETLGARERQRFEIDRALAFSEALPREELASYFRSRVDALSEAVRHLAEHQVAQSRDPDVPPIAAAIFSHSRHHLEAEFAWSKEVLASIEAGGLFGKVE
jgi:DNA-binding PadR family transcriptional regulator